MNYIPMQLVKNDIENERQSIINKLQRIDSNGVWSDKDNIAEGYEPMTLQEAKEALYRIESRDYPVVFEG